jgi:hypothetical protein
MNMDTLAQSKHTIPEADGYRRAIELLQVCSSDDGFLAAPSEKANYRRVWSRDGVIIGLAALMTGDAALIETFRRSLSILAKHQGPQGEIPSNVDAVTGRVSYGGTTGRVDAGLWFVIGCGEYWRATGDDGCMEQMLPVLERVDFLLRAWEFNNRGLLFVPPAGDWADEYIQSGYVLYDQLLYLQAQRTLAAIHHHRSGRPDQEREDRAARLERFIRANYWFYNVEETPEGVYHEVFHEKGHVAMCGRAHWAPFFSPHGYGFRFDSFANVLVSLFDVADNARREYVDGHIDELVDRGPGVLPAFFPVIEPVHDEWKDMQVNFSYTFRNQPYEYHNGGLWPMLTGFYVADLARRGRRKKARLFLDAIHRANAMPMEGEPWSFPEFVHGRDHTAGGTRHQGWSAAAAVIGHHAIRGEPLFRIDRDSGNGA